MEKAERSARSDEQKSSVAIWKQELRARKERINNTRDTEVSRLLALVVVGISDGDAGKV